MAGRLGSRLHGRLIDVVRFEVPVLLREGVGLNPPIPEDDFPVTADELIGSILLHEVGIGDGVRRGSRVPDVLFAYGDGEVVVVEVGRCKINKWYHHEMADEAGGK
jgi:hypothetical protein